MKRLLVIIVGSAVLGVALGAALVWYQQPERSYRTVTSDEINTVTRNTATSATGTQSNATSAPPNSGDASGVGDSLDRCITQKREVAQEADYEKGTLLVSFHDDVAFDDAVAVAQEVGATASTSEDARDQYSDRGWFEVSLPQAQLFQTQCRLEQKSEVATTRLNITFDLAD